LPQKKVATRDPDTLDLHRRAACFALCPIAREAARPQRGGSNNQRERLNAVV